MCSYARLTLPIPCKYLFSFCTAEKLIRLGGSYIISVLSSSNGYLDKFKNDQTSYIITIMNSIQITAKQLFNQFLSDSISVIDKSPSKPGILPFMRILPVRPLSFFIYFIFFIFYLLFFFLINLKI